jgi:hypothetical protein
MSALDGKIYKMYFFFFSNNYDNGKEEKLATLRSSQRRAYRRHFN